MGPGSGSEPEEDDDPEIIEVPNLLHAKAAAPGGKTLADLIKLGDARLRVLTEEYKKQRVTDLKELTALMREMKAAPALSGDLVQRLINKAHDIQGLGSTFGYALVTDIASLLCKLAKELRDRLAKGEVIPLIAHEAIEAHVGALEVAISADMQGSGGEAGERLLSGLRKAAEKATKTG
jgi:hypothetical protein